MRPSGLILLAELWPSDELVRHFKITIWTRFLILHFSFNLLLRITFIEHWFDLNKIVLVSFQQQSKCTKMDYCVFKLLGIVEFLQEVLSNGEGTRVGSFYAQSLQSCICFRRRREHATPPLTQIKRYLISCQPRMHLSSTAFGARFYSGRSLLVCTRWLTVIWSFLITAHKEHNPSKCWG